MSPSREGDSLTIIEHESAQTTVYSVVWAIYILCFLFCQLLYVYFYSTAFEDDFGRQRETTTAPGAIPGRELLKY